MEESRADSQDAHRLKPTVFERKFLLALKPGGAHEFDPEDRPHGLQGSFEIHETRDFISWNPTVVMKLGREFAAGLAEQLPNYADVRLKLVLQGLPYRETCAGLTIPHKGF